MKYPIYQEKMRPGLIFGDSVRSYVLEAVSPELTILRGTVEGKRQESSAKTGSRRAIPTDVILDLVGAIESGKITLDDILRRNRRDRDQPPIFESLGLDHDPFILGYDSTILKVCTYLITGENGIPELFPFPLGTVSRQIEYPLPKPFLLLAGISGTGKSRWVREQASATKGALAERENLLMIPVRPDWHEPSDLLGYVSRVSGSAQFVPTDFLAFLVRAWQNACQQNQNLHPDAAALGSMVPFWLCLDEMNLAPVEQYFADYLSVLEERSWEGGTYHCPPLLKFGKDADAIRAALKPVNATLWDQFAEAGGIPLPPNLIVVGTVNMDETTHGFSRKVLDRALTVEFDEVSFEAFEQEDFESANPLPWSGLSSVTDARLLAHDPPTKDAVLALLRGWNQIVDQTAFRIAYRTINEALLIAASLEGRTEADVLDWVVMTKLLPRLEGDEEKLRAPQPDANVQKSYLDVLEADWLPRFGHAWGASKTHRKLEFMKGRLERSGFTSFWP